MKTCVHVAAALISAAFGSTAWSAADAQPAYGLVRTVPLGGPESWDYVRFDPARAAVFVAHGDHVDVVDAATGAVSGRLEGLEGAHGIVIDATRERAYADSGQRNTISVFDLKTGGHLAEIPTDAGPDAMAFDPSSGHVFSMNGGGASTTVVDPSVNKAIATVDLGGRPEFAAADGDGGLYINIEDRNELVRLDTRTNTVTAHWPLTGCQEPRGLAIDAPHRRVFSGCANETMTVVDADDGKLISRLTIGRGNDAVAFDATHQLVFSANGFGSISIFREQSPDSYVKLADVPTNLGARTMDLDPATGRLFVATADVTVHPEETEIRRRYSVAPGSVRLLMFDPPAAK